MNSLLQPRKNACSGNPKRDARRLQLDSCSARRVGGEDDCLTFIAASPLPSLCVHTKNQQVDGVLHGPSRHPFAKDVRTGCRSLAVGR